MPDLKLWQALSQTTWIRKDESDPHARTQSLQEMVLYMIFFFDLLKNRHRNILPVTFHCSGDISVTAMLVFVIIERHRMV